MEPLGGNLPSRPSKMGKDRLDQPTVRGAAAVLAIVRNLTHRPEELDQIRPADLTGKGLLGTDLLQHPMVVGVTLAPEHPVTVGWKPLETLKQPGDGGIVELVIAPKQSLQGRKPMVFNRGNGRGRQLVLAGVKIAALPVQRLIEGEGAETTGILMPPGTTRNLRQLSQLEVPQMPAVELPETRKGNMGQGEIKPKANRIGRDQVIDLTRLKELDLGIAGSWAEVAHDHRAATVNPPHLVGQAIDLGGGEGDNRRAARQFLDLAGRTVAQFRKPRTGNDLEPWQQMIQHRPQRFRAQNQGLVKPAGVKQPLGEDVASLRIRRQLCLVDGDQGEVAVGWHGLYRRDKPLRLSGDNPLLAGHQGDPLGALDRPDLVVDLPRQQP